MLTSLTIKNFRALEDFNVPTLGRVNLIVGKNNAGKSTVLEAIRIFASNANLPMLAGIAVSHDEQYMLKESDGEDIDNSLPFEDFFSGRCFPSNDNQAIEIGDHKNGDMLKIEHIYYIEERFTKTEANGETTDSSRTKRILKQDLAALHPQSGKLEQGLLIQKGDQTSNIRFEINRMRRGISGLTSIPGSKPCSLVPTQLISIDELANDWDKIALTANQTIVQDALRLILPTFEAIAFVRNDERKPPRWQDRPLRRTAKVKLANLERLVPLNSLGEGMLRILQMALKVFPAKGGFLLIDEFESGLHYSVQEKIWALLFDLARKLNIQVFATTHSWDCVENFAKVAKAQTDIDGVLLHIGESKLNSDQGRIIATVFNEKELYELTQAAIEVR